MSNHLISMTYKRDLGTGTRKSLMVLLADKASDDGQGIYASKQTIACELNVTKKTVITNIDQLVVDGLLVVVGERPCNGGYTVEYAINVAALEDVPLVACHARHENRKSQKGSEGGSPGKIFHRANSFASGSEGGSPKPSLNPIPPLSPNGDKTPTLDLKKVSKKNKTKAAGQSSRRKSKQAGSKLPDDWKPPAIHDLSAVAIKLIRQWPPGAYQAVCELFRLHYQSNTGPQGIRSNWNDVLSKWIIGDHAKIMRDAAAGVSFAELTPKEKGAKASLARPVKSKDREDDTSRRMHDLLRRTLGSHIHEQWISKAALICNSDQTVSVFVGSEFQKSWIEERWHDRIGNAAREAMGSSIKSVIVQVDQG